MQILEVKNKNTGYIFNLEKAVVDDLMKNEPENFEVLNKDYVAPKTDVEETSVFKAIVEEPKKTTTKAKSKKAE